VAVSAPLSTAAGSGSTAAQTINAPSGIAVGDLLVAYFNQRSTSATQTAPDGTWTNVYNARGSNANVVWDFIWWKIAVSADTTAVSYAFTGVAQKWVGEILRFSGADATTPLVLATNDNASGTTVFPAVTGIASGRVLHVAGGSRGGVTVTSYSTDTLAFTPNNTGTGNTDQECYGGYSSVIGSSGSQAAVTYTTTNVTANLSHSIAIGPATATGTTFTKDGAATAGTFAGAGTRVVERPRSAAALAGSVVTPLGTRALERPRTRDGDGSGGVGIDAGRGSLAVQHDRGGNGRADRSRR
jgi:hypothetical protein